jgi:exodeoxyribonuclease V beta subunit
LQTLNAPAGSWQQLLATIDAEATRLLTAWRSEGPGFDAAIAETRLNSKGREALQEALPRMDAVLAGAASLDHETVHALSRDFLASELAKKKGNALPALTVFDIAQTLDEHGTALYRRLLTDALVELPRRLADAKDRSGQLGYDDLLRLLDAGLRGAGGARLAATIREQYPVALIDEFQGHRSAPVGSVFDNLLHRGQRAVPGR